MVRSLVGGCIQVGMGKRSTDWFREKMAVPLREGSTGPIAPQGLTLEHVAYPADDELAERAERIRAKRCRRGGGREGRRSAGRRTVRGATDS